MVEGLERLDDELNTMNEWAKAVFFDHEGRVIATKNYEPDSNEINSYLGTLESRDKTIGKGFTLAGNHFDVHRFHPPLVYGRRGGPDEGEGIAFCQAMRNGVPVYAVITYEFPILSARAVPQLIEFCRQHIGTVEVPPPS